MKRRTQWIAAGALTAALVGGGAGIAVATGDDDASDTPITGSALDRASKVALEYTGGGRVTATEIGDEEGYYEIEVRRDDGSQVDVHLDRDFNVLNSKGDSEHEDEGSTEK